jgi:Ca2+-binding EF-hand superfamily protein
MDDNNSKSLDIDEFRKACGDFRVAVPDESITVIFKAFDLNRDNSISYDEFLRIMRGEMN